VRYIFRIARPFPEKTLLSIPQADVAKALAIKIIKRGIPALSVPNSL